MAEVDTSSYGKELKSPFETLGALTNIQNQANQNKLFQQQFNTQRAVSEGMKASINPDTGEYDPAKLRAWVATDPNAGYGLQQVIQGSQEAQGRNIANDTAQLANRQKHVEATINAISPLIGKHITEGDLLGALSSALTNKQITVQEFMKMHDMVPRDQNGDINQEATQGILQHMQMQLMSPQERLNATAPAPQLVQTPQGQIPMRFPQMGNPSQAGDVIPNVPAPTTVQYDQSGQGSYVGNLPNGGMAGGGGLKPGTLATAPPGSLAAADVAAGGSAKSYQNLRDDVGASGARIFQLNKALTALEGTNTGPGTETTNNIKSFLLAQSPDVLSKIMPGVDPNKIKNYDEANKYLTAYASGAAGAVGPHTDNQLATALSANASTKISNLAAKDVVKANIALEKMKQAAAIQFKNSGEPPQNFSDWYANYNKFADPRAFLADQQPAKARNAMMDKMNSKELASYVNSFKAALKSGVINLEDLPK